jgi:hypothetical protein
MPPPQRGIPPAPVERLGKVGTAALRLWQALPEDTPKAEPARAGPARPRPGRTPVPARVHLPIAASSPEAPKTPSSPPAREGSGPVPGKDTSRRRPRRPVVFRTAAPPRRSVSTDRSSVVTGPRRAADRSLTAVPVRGIATAVRPSAPRNRSPHRTASAAGGCVRSTGACLQGERPACAAFRTAAPLRRSVWATSSSAHRSLAGSCATVQTLGRTDQPRP